MEEMTYRKLRNVVSTAPRPQGTWIDLKEGSKPSLIDPFNPNSRQENSIDKLKSLVLDFLELVSGGEVVALLNDVLHPGMKEDLPAASGFNDASGRKRLEKLNSLIQRSPPLKPWPLRENTQSKMRLEIELSARRSLSYLSGGHIVAILKDILYADEKDMLADKYRLAVQRLGEATRHMKPKSKGKVLNAMKLSGFTRDDLRERGWTFSTNLWKSAALFASLDESSSTASMMPRPMGIKKSRPRMRSLERSIITETSVRRHENTLYDFDDEEVEEDSVEHVSNNSGGSSSTSSPFKKSKVMVINNFIEHSRSGSRLPSSSEDEDALELERRLERSNPLFPQI